MTDNKWFFIINPNAGKGLGQKKWPEISKLLEKYEFNYDFEFTHNRGHAFEISQKVSGEKYQNVVGVGGDGTMNEVINGVMTNTSGFTNTISVGMIPVGTGNDFARNNNIPLNYDKAIQVLKLSKTALHDVGKATYYSDGKQAAKYSYIIAGMGFDGEVNLKSNIDKRNGRGGKIVYIKNLLLTLITYKPIIYNITDDNGSYDMLVFTLAVGKGKRNGGGMMQLPNAKPDDGFLDYTVVEKVPRRTVVALLPKLFKGTHVEHPKVSTFKTKKLFIKTHPNVLLEIDGEDAGRAPFSFEIVPKALKIITNLD